VIEVRKGAEWIIGTPGRLLDLLNRKVLNLSKLKTIILDEADQMLQFGNVSLSIVGFQENVEEILQHCFEAVKKEET
jgi:superfamily II DNA/RNA helicase